MNLFIKIDDSGRILDMIQSEDEFMDGYMKAGDGRFSSSMIWDEATQKFIEPTPDP